MCVCVSVFVCALLVKPSSSPAKLQGQLFGGAEVVVAAAFDAFAAALSL